MSGPPMCEHLAQARRADRERPAECDACKATGDEWENLRICLACGHVGCCDDSPNRHAKAHHDETGHPVMEQVTAGAGWLWCFVDQQLSEPGAEVDGPTV